MCTDQEAVDLIRHTYDPQNASKLLVDHALARFSTDNLSCMVVRFDSKAAQQTVEQKAEPIGVEGDPPSNKKGGISEADAIVKEARKSMGDSGKFLHSDVHTEDVEEERSRMSQEIIREESEKEVGPELDPDGVTNLSDAQKKSL